MTQFRQNSQTAEAILDAATKLFARKGYEGVRVNALAESVGVNKATLYYQIGDKLAIYQQVVDRMLRQTVDAVEGATAEIDDCEERIERYISTIAESTGSIRYLAPIMLREIASGGERIPAITLERMGHLMTILGQAIDEGIAQGRFRPVASFPVHMMILGSLNLYTVNEPLRQRLTQQYGNGHPSSHFLSPPLMARQISELILAALRTNRGEPPHE